MADSETITPAATAAPAVNTDPEARQLLAFLQDQRSAVLKTVAGLPEEAWQRPVVPSGWTVAGMLAHVAGAEYHWFHQVTAGIVEEPEPADDGAEQPAWDPAAAFTCEYPSAEIIAEYRDICRRSDEILAVTPLSAAPRRPDLHQDPVYAAQVTDVRFIVLHLIEETAVHSGHLEIARELLDGQTRLAGR
jgi:uncharacterized damage-inducible protein DinB